MLLRATTAGALRRHVRHRSAATPIHRPTPPPPQILSTDEPYPVVLTTLHPTTTQDGTTVLTQHSHMPTTTTTTTDHHPPATAHAQQQQQQPLPPVVAHLVLRREARRNALSRNMVDALRTEFAKLRANPPAALLLSSSRPDVFCAGADLKERASLSPTHARALSHDLRTAFTELANLPCPTIAVVQGFALGGGAELALACDMRVASHAAVFAFPETSLAIIPGAGGTQRLPRIVGLSRAKELIFTGRRVAATEAARIGLVDILVHSDNTSNPTDVEQTQTSHHASPGGDDDPALQRAIEMAAKLTECGPLALQLAKTAINHGFETDIDRGLAIEAACYYQTITTADRNEGVAAFNERRKPRYTGR